MSNGCGCERGLLKYVKPPYTKYFYAACCLHDNDYDFGGTEADRRLVDKELFSNMLHTIQKNEINPWKMIWLCHIALFYYVSVRIFGRFYFNYT